MNTNMAEPDLVVSDEIIQEKFEIQKYTYLHIKRVFDVVLSFFGIIVLLPAFIVIGILIKYDSHGPVFYKHKRIGKNGKTIYLYKFRTMVNDADNILKEMLKEEKYRKQWEENQKIENDPRITNIGKIIRKLSIDELPQLFNVLKGEMSLIGPRPLVEGELDAHHGNHEIYESIRPGISGWWAANGRSSITYKERLELEYYYVKNCSLKLDIKCFFKTIAIIMSRKGAK